MSTFPNRYFTVVPLDFTPFDRERLGPRMDLWEFMGLHNAYNAWLKSVKTSRRARESEEISQLKFEMIRLGALSRTLGRSVSMIC